MTQGDIKKQSALERIVPKNLNLKLRLQKLRLTPLDLNKRLTLVIPIGTPRLKYIAFLEACLIGLLSGLAAVALKWGVGWVGGVRMEGVARWGAMVVLPLFGGLLGWVSGWIIQRFAPETAGSGIPQVKAALAYLPMRLGGRVAIVKLISTMLSLGAGLTLGRQGPTVHLGAAIASQVSEWFPTSPDHRRHLLAAGAAAGLAAGFNAPIAGVLFVVEELLQDVSGLTLGTAILASFVGAVVSRQFGGQEFTFSPSWMDITPYFNAWETPFFLVLGVLAGVLGVLFVRGVVASLDLYKRLRLSLPGQVAIAGLLSGVVLAVSPAILRDNASLQEVWRTSEFPWELVLLMFGVKFGLTLLAVGSGAPGGLFAPSLILGSALGYLVCYGTTAIVTWMRFPIGIEAGAGFAVTFALAGMAAFFSAVTRGPITAIVIVFEMTQEFSMVLPLMIASVTAYLVGEAIMTGSVYKYLLARNGIHLKSITPMESRLSGLKAADIMQRQVEVLQKNMSIPAAKQVFLRSTHRGFPVVNAGELVGILTQSDFARLETLDNTLAETELDISHIMTRNPITVRGHDPLPQVLYWLNHYKIGRIPVMDQTQLLGVITRADIIRVESEQLSGRSGGGLGGRDLIAKNDPSYLVFQTRDPAIGRGKILLPLHNPHTAPALMEIAAGIAADRGYELECLVVAVVSRLRPPAQTAVATADYRKMLRAAKRLRDRYSIPVHTQIRVSHDVSSAILEVIRDRHINLMIMGWKGSTEKPDRILGTVVDTLIQQATCDVMLVKLGQAALLNLNLQLNLKLDRWLIPTAGGPHSQRAIALLPGLMKQSSQPEAFLCHVSDPDSEAEVSQEALDRACRTLQSKVSCVTHAIAVCSNSIPDAVGDLASGNGCDVILLGATQSGLLQQVIQGNIPETIARRSTQTVIVVRGALLES